MYLKEIDINTRNWAQDRDCLRGLEPLGFISHGVSILKIFSLMKKFLHFHKFSVTTWERENNKVKINPKLVSEHYGTMVEEITFKIKIPGDGFVKCSKPLSL